jgi:hypothetical protein
MVVKVQAVHLHSRTVFQTQTGRKQLGQLELDKMSQKKPAPMYNRPERTECPVCGQSSYSSGGIHPQCAVKQTEAEEKRNVDPTQVSAKQPKATKSATGSWQKTCPKCKIVLHIRKKKCACSYVFPDRNAANEH